VKTVVVTGVSRGLGLAVAQRVLSDPAFRLVGLSRTLSADFQALMQQAPGRSGFVACDIGESDALGGIVRAIAKDHGPIFGLVNNAAIGPDALLASMHQADIEQVLRVNLLGPILLTRLVARTMLARREGRIVNIGSIAAGSGFSGLSVYAASKAGLAGFTRALSRELGKRGITVNCVAPGYMETAMTEAMPEEKQAQVRRRAPLGLARPEDAAGAVMYLLGPDGARVTGSTITVDGGSTA
jgi:3-oxoacyl-[acyl-carrier protein] reductase